MPFDNKAKIIIFILGVSFFLVLPAYPQMPKSVISEREHNFGKAWGGDSVMHVFKLKNVGDADLKIKDVQITGSFTSIMGNKTIHPGQEVEITLVMDTDKLKGDVETGAILYTNDPASPHINLKMRGKVIPIIDIEPMTALFFSTYRGESAKKSVTILNNYEKPLEISKVENPSTRFQVKLDTVRPGREYRLAAEVNPKADLGRTMEKVILYTNNERYPKITI